MARRGNGVGKGPGQGDGWGGPAKGAGSHAGQAPNFELGNSVAAGLHDMSGSERAQMLKDQIFELAMSAEREETRLSAAVAWLNREEGMPVSRSQVDANVNNTSVVSDVPMTLEQWNVRYASGLVTATGSPESTD